MLHCCSPPTTGRVRVPFRTSKRHISGRTEDWVLQEYQIKELTSRWGQLFATHRTIKRFVDSPDGTPPPETVLLEFGALLFETLLPGDVKRLFDVARSREQEKLLIIFTSTIPWVFDMPWEFARDPTRGTFLATEDALFVRNIFTTTLVDRLPPKQGAAALADCYVGAGRSRPVVGAAGGHRHPQRARPSGRSRPI